MPWGHLEKVFGCQCTEAIVGWFAARMELTTELATMSTRMLDTVALQLVSYTSDALSTARACGLHFEWIRLQRESPVSQQLRTLDHISSHESSVG